jgi:hypothetical protein
MPNHEETKPQKRDCMPGQELEIRKKSKNVRHGNRQTGTKKTCEISATHLSGSYNPDLMTDYDAVEIFNKVLRKKEAVKRDHASG